MKGWKTGDLLVCMRGHLQVYRVAQSHGEVGSTATHSYSFSAPHLVCRRLAHRYHGQCASPLSSITDTVVLSAFKLAGLDAAQELVPLVNPP